MGIVREFVSRFSDSDDMRRPRRWMTDGAILLAILDNCGVHYVELKPK
jgi:hypothetical protein